MPDADPKQSSAGICQRFLTMQFLYMVMQWRMPCFTDVEQVSFLTASAVVGDIFEIARNIKNNCSARIGCTCYKELPVKKMADTHNRYFLRLLVEDRCGVLAEMTAVFAKYHVSVEQIVQKASKHQDCAEIVVITAKVREGDFRTAMEELSGRSSVRKISSMLRVYGE